MKRPPRNPRESVFANGPRVTYDLGWATDGCHALTVQALAIGRDCIGKPLFSMCYAWARWGTYCCHSIQIKNHCSAEGYSPTNYWSSSRTRLPSILHRCNLRSCPANPFSNTQAIAGKSFAGWGFVITGVHCGGNWKMAATEPSNEAYRMPLCKEYDIPKVNIRSVRLVLLTKKYSCENWTGWYIQVTAILAFQHLHRHACCNWVSCKDATARRLSCKICEAFIKKLESTTRIWSGTK